MNAVKWIYLSIQSNICASVLSIINKQMIRFTIYIEHRFSR